MPTLLFENRAAPLQHASSRPDGLWVELAELERATGWTLKPEGACRGEVCVPLPRGREQEFAQDGSLNLTALATYLGQPVIRDEPSDTWAIGEAPEVRSAALRTTEAPDFTLPDLDGREHSLSDYRGRKVFLVSWASW